MQFYSFANYTVTLTNGNDLKSEINKALILAAGMGSRLNDEKTPKPLKKLLGVPLLARTILTLEQAGISDFYVVIGYKGEQIKQGIEKFLKGRVAINWIENPDWKLPNGHSVLAAKDHIKENFIMTMSDHLFTPDTINKLRTSYAQKGGDLHLAVDFNPSVHHDIDDATKVEVQEDKIFNIGKKIPKYHAYDTGVFLVTPRLFEALDKAYAEKGKVELSDGVRTLCEEKQAYVVDIEQNLWFDIDLPKEFKIGEKLLLKSLIKPTDGIIAKNLNRHVSLFFSKYLARTCLTPNMVTVLTFFIALYCAYIVTQGGYLNFLIGGILFQLTSILDGCDGELARVKFQSSQYGAWIDTIFDNLSYVLTLLGISIGCYRTESIPDIFHQVGFGALILGLIIFPTFYIYLQLNNRKASLLDVDYGIERMSPLAQKAFKFVYLLGKRDLFALLFMFMAIFGILEYGIFYSAIIFVGLILMITRAFIIAASKKK